MNNTKTLCKHSVDVIVPVYNGEKYIEEALQSIIDQTYSPKTIFVIDDASTDNTKTVVLNFAQHSKIGIEYCRLDKNSGPSKARNIGIEKSTAEYIAFLDADDIWVKDKLEKQVKIFKDSDDPKLGIVYCKYYFIDNNGGKIYSKGEDNIIYVRGNIEKELYKNRVIPFSHCQVLARRICLNGENLFDENLRIGEDLDFLIRLSKQYNFDYSNEILLKVRRHESNTTNDRYYSIENLIRLREKYGNEIFVTRMLPENLIYLAYKENCDGRITSLIKNLPQKTKNKLFPITRGNIRLAILLYSPKWAMKYVVNKLYHFL